MRKTFYILTLCIFIIMLNSGCSVLQKLGLSTVNDELRPVSSVILDEDEAAKIMDKKLIRLYFADEDNTKLRAELRYIKSTDADKNTESLATTIVKELIKGPGKGTGLRATIPENVELKSPVIIEGHIAIVDLSKEFIENHSGGKDSEKLTIYSIVNSLTELQGIKKVKFRVEGKEKTEFKGGFKFDAPFPRSTSIISKKPPVKGEIETTEDEGENEIITDKNNEEKSKETFGEYDEEEILE